MIDSQDRLTPATPDDLAEALAFALRFDGRKRKHDAAEMMARIVAKRLVEHLERSGFVIARKRRVPDRRGLVTRGPSSPKPNAEHERGLPLAETFLAIWWLATYQLIAQTAPSAF
ncbi:MAG: hypothetical protein ABSC25_17195 [Roseiarcus sp.]